MIEIEIPKDISKIESKMIWIFTKRQLIALIAGLAVCIPAYMGIGKLIPSDNSAKIFIIIILALPFIAFGWIKPYEMPFEQFIISIFRSLVVATKVRKYSTNNLYEVFAEQIQKETLDEAQNQNSKNTTKSKDLKQRRASNGFNKQPKQTKAKQNKKG